MQRLKREGEKPERVNESECSSKITSILTILQVPMDNSLERIKWLFVNLADFPLNRNQYLVLTRFG